MTALVGGPSSSRMLPALDAAHPLFDLPAERSRSFLRWAQRLAQAEGVILLVGACMTTRASGGENVALALFAVVLALLSLQLGVLVGRGSAHAAVILLGLSVSRTLMIFVPGGSPLWVNSLPVGLIELAVFTQGARGAVALGRGGSPEERFARFMARPATPPPPATAPVHRVSPAPAVRRAMGIASAIEAAPRAAETVRQLVEPVVEPVAATLDQSAGKGVIDIVVAAVFGALGAWAFHFAGTYHGEGAAGLIAIPALLAACGSFLVSLVLLVAGVGGLRGKRWAANLRVAVYGLLALGLGSTLLLLGAALV